MFLLFNILSFLLLEVNKSQCCCCSPNWPFPLHLRPRCCLMATNSLGHNNDSRSILLRILGKFWFLIFLLSMLCDTMAIEVAIKFLVLIGNGIFKLGQKDNLVISLLCVLVLFGLQHTRRSNSTI
jgi:hypothetical protein